MAQAVICPVCLGKGKIDEETCHGCGGKGWVEVQDYQPPYYPVYPPYYPWYPSYYPWYPSPIITYTWQLQDAK